MGCVSGRIYEVPAGQGSVSAICIYILNTVIWIWVTSRVLCCIKTNGLSKLCASVNVAFRRGNFVWSVAVICIKIFLNYSSSDVVDAKKSCFVFRTYSVYRLKILTNFCFSFTHFIRFLSVIPFPLLFKKSVQTGKVKPRNICIK